MPGGVQIEISDYANLYGGCYMARRSRKGRINLKTTPVSEGTFVVAVILWLVGFADVILGVFTLPSNLGIWLLALSGLLLILGALVKGL